MLSKFALTVLVITALAVSGTTFIEQDVVTTYEHFTNVSDPRRFSEDLDHVQDLVSRNPHDRAAKHQLRVTLSKPPGKTQYLGRVRVGKSIYALVFATATFDMWVDPSARKTYRTQALGTRLASPFSVNIFDGEAKGWNYRNTVEVDGLEIPDIPFASALKWGFGDEVGDGVIPLRPLREYRKLKFPTFWELAAEKLERNVVAFSHRLTFGEVHIGMTDPTTYIGNIEYHSCKHASNPHLWTIDHAKISVGSNVLDLNDETITFDTASQYIRGPPNAVREIYKLIPGSQKLQGGLYGYPCDTIPPKITIQLGNSGRAWPIEPYIFNRWGKQTNPAHPIHPNHPQHGFYEKLRLHPDPNHTGHADHSQLLCIGLFAAHTKYTASIREDPKDGRNRPSPALTPTEWRIGHPFLVGKYLVLNAETMEIGLAALPQLSPFLVQHIKS